MTEKFDHEKTLELIRSSKAGDDDAKSQLILANTPLIKSIVKRYRGKGVEYDDLMQLGSMGLIKAIDNFDESFNVRFSTYAVPMIMGEIKRFLRDDGYMKVSRSVKTLYHKVMGFISEEKLKGKGEPKINEIAEHFGVSAEEIVFCLDAGKMPISIFEKVDETDEKSQNVVDRMIVLDNTEATIDRLALKEVLLKLTKREQKIIMLRYFRDKTQSEIAKHLGVSQVQVSRLENKIIEKLRELMM